MLIEKPEEFKKWLSGQLATICDADPNALAKYILALVKKDKSSQALKIFLLEQLEIFMIEDVKKFVDLLMDALQKKSYLDSAPVEQLNPPSENKVSTSLTESSFGAKNALQGENVSSSMITPSLISDSTENDSKNSMENTDSWKRKVDDKHIPSKKVKVSSSEDSLPSRTLEIVKNSNEAFTTSIHSPSKSRENKNCVNPTEGGTDLKIKQVEDLTNAKKQKESETYSTKQSSRCKDYDEKGYCLKGDFCDFDHGNDPILVEQASASFFCADLTPEQHEGKDRKSPLPPLPTSPPTIPPPPPPFPPPPSDPFIPEPYNPESPGMNMTTLPSCARNSQLFFYGPSLLHPPPYIPFPSSHSLPPRIPTPSSSIHNMMWSNAEHSFHNKTKQRTRELIGVTTVDSSTSNMVLDKGGNKDPYNARTYLKPLNSGYGNFTRALPGNQGDLKARGFNYSRLGPYPRRKCLEVRKIPKSLNTITNLHSHFCKFGNVVNIEVCYADDPEAAKVSFSTHSEANAAYRSTEPIFNNRFIKLFWNNDFNKGMGITSSIEVKPKEVHSSAENNKGLFLNHIATESNEDGAQKPDKFATSKRNISQNTYVPTPCMSLSKGNGSSVLTSSNKGAGKEAIEAHKRKKLELINAKSDFIKSQIKHQKTILELLMKVKTTKEKDYLKKTLQNISEKIVDLQTGLKKDSEELRNLLKTTPQVILKSTTKKDLLDAELDLYSKHHSGDDDTSALALKVLKMKNKAKALGLIENTSRSHKYAFKKCGISRYHPNAISSHSVDHRPRKILVHGTSDKEGLLQHFKQFGDLENIEEVEGGIVLSFSSRIEAEMAYSYGKKFEAKVLTLAWYNDSHTNVIQSPDIENPELKTSDAELMDTDEEDDDDEDSEARSWRR